MRQAVQQSALRCRANEEGTLDTDGVRRAQRILEVQKAVLVTRTSDTVLDTGASRMSKDKTLSMSLVEEESDFITYHYSHVQEDSTSLVGKRSPSNPTKIEAKGHDIVKRPLTISLPSISFLLSSPYIDHQFRPLISEFFLPPTTRSSILESPIRKATNTNTHVPQLSQAGPKISSTKTSALRRLRPVSHLSEAIAKALCRKNITHGPPSDICWH